MKATLIFLISFAVLLSGCSHITQYQTMPDVTFSRIDLDNDELRPYQVTGQDPKTCQFNLKPQPKVPLRNRANHGSVVLSDADWQKIRPLLNSYCAAKKKKP